MIRKIATFFGLLLALPLSSHAWVGGPFDGGDYNQLLDDNGVYQASFRFKNGSGFSQFGNNVKLGPSVATGTGGSNSTATTSSSIGGVLNRTVIYYEGITYFGTATGIVDHERGEITGISNAQSEVTLSESASSSSSGSFFLFGSTNEISASTTIVNNAGRGFVANAVWNAKITKSHPELEFSGSGEITFLGPDSTTLISEIAQDILDSTNEALTPQAVPIANTVIFTETITSGDTVTTNTTTFARDVSEIIADQQAVLEYASAVTAVVLDNQLANLETVSDLLVNSPALQQDVVVEKLTVYGSRKFFLSQR